MENVFILSLFGMKMIETRDSQEGLIMGKKVSHVLGFSKVLSSSKLMNDTSSWKYLAGLLQPVSLVGLYAVLERSDQVCSLV